MLSSWGVRFEAVNVEENPSAAEELERRGLRLVPVVMDGGRAFHGWNPEELARFAGVTHQHEERLAPAELASRLDRILEAAGRAIREFPLQGLEANVPRRERTVRELAFHLFRVSLAYRDALETRSFPESWLQETPPAEMRDGAALARYGEGVRKRLADWWTHREACAGDVETYYGRQSAQELLERTVWHAAQHFRQIQTLLESQGVSPKDTLGPADFKGLPLPEELW